MSIPTSPVERVKLALSLMLIALPIFVFYVLLGKTAVRIPILDDYNIILEQLNALSGQGMIPRLYFLITATHNGYKLMFENAIILLQYNLLGHVQFLPLVYLGNAFALVIFLTVARMMRAASGELVQRRMVLVPVAFMVLQLQYASALNFASSSLQHLAAVSFSMLAICLLDRESQWTFWGACMSLLLAIAASPNGFFVAPAGFLLLVQSKKWRGAIVWSVTTLLMLGLYLFRYHPDTGDVPSTNAGNSLPHVNLIYALSFLGSSAAKFTDIGPSVVLGLVFCCLLGWAIKRRYYRANPAIFYGMIFILINALAVSSLRSDLGVAQSLASRYRIQSNLFLAFVYLFLVESELPRWKSKGLRQGFAVAAFLVSAGFCCLSDLAGARFLVGKKAALTYSYRVEWQGVSPDAVKMGPEVTANPALMRQISLGVYKMDLKHFRESVRLGIMVPPDNP